jgi:hypothetical protein
MRETAFFSSFWHQEEPRNTVTLPGFNGTKFTLETPKLHGSIGNCCYAAQTFSATPKQDGQRIQSGGLRIGTPGMPFTFEPTGSSRTARQ